MDLVRAEFEAWLKQNPQEETAGVAGACEECPIARYILSRDSDNHHHVEVFYRTHYILTGDESDYTDNPQWVMKFITTLDSNYGDKYSRESRSVTFSQALECLQAIPLE